VYNITAAYRPMIPVENSDMSYDAMTEKAPEFLPICVRIASESGMTSWR
jgi:hypothetical protein